MLRFKKPLSKVWPISRTASQPELSLASWHRINMLGALKIKQAHFQPLRREEKYKVPGLLKKWDTAGLHMLPSGRFRKTTELHMAAKETKTWENLLLSSWKARWALSVRVGSPICRGRVRFLRGAGLLRRRPRPGFFLPCDVGWVWKLMLAEAEKKPLWNRWLSSSPRHRLIPNPPRLILCRPRASRAHKSRGGRGFEVRRLIQGCQRFGEGHRRSC